jgi:transposase InsO family protein
LKRGLWTRTRTVVLMLDEIIITETPPLYCCYGRAGQQVCVPITGNRAKRIVHGVINILTGTVLLLITTDWDANTHQYFLEMIRAHWRGWQIILFEDRGSPHTAEDSLECAADLGIEVRLLPRACPELNAMGHLFRSVRGRGVANRQTRSIDESAMIACRHIYNLTPRERLVKAGVLSGRFWLTS